MRISSESAHPPRCATQREHQTMGPARPLSSADLAGWEKQLLVLKRTGSQPWKRPAGSWLERVPRGRIQILDLVQNQRTGRGAFTFCRQTFIGQRRRASRKACDHRQHRGGGYFFRLPLPLPLPPPFCGTATVTACVPTLPAASLAVADMVWLPAPALPACQSHVA